MTRHNGISTLVARLEREKAWPSERRKAAREEVDCSQRELAAALGVAQPTVTNWERGGGANGKLRPVYEAYLALLAEFERLAQEIPKPQ